MRKDDKERMPVTYNQGIWTGMRRAERREWWLWFAAALITLLLTMGLVSFVVPLLHSVGKELEGFDMVLVMRGLIALVLLFDVYVIYQQLQICRIRRQLVQREQVFRLITENAADMIAVVDSKGHQLYNSPAFEKILGYSGSELASTPAFEKVHPEDRAMVEAAAFQASDSAGVPAIEYRMQHKDGSWRTLESTASTIPDGHGNVDKIIIVNRDITDRKRLEERFRLTQKLEAIGRLSGGIAHDFNNLLGVIIGYAEILQENVAEDHPDRSCVDEIVRAGQRAASLTRQLLAFSRQQVLEPTVLDLNGVLANMEKMLRRTIGEDIELITEPAGDLGHVKADEGQLEQVILNLAVNARDAMPEGGKLIIQTKNTFVTEAETMQYSYAFTPGRYVLLTVTDTGVGMDAAIKGRIFEPFFTTKERGKGTGLGLSTVFGVVKQSNGYIEVHSEVGHGSTFRVYLPIVEEPMAVQKPNALITRCKGGQTILLAEDETKLRVLTKTMLERLGFTVLEAGNGKEACEVARQHPASIHLLLTDIVMPGMNGCQLAEALAPEFPEMKILYTSGYTGQGLGQEIIPAGSHFLRKPFSRESLGAKIQEVMEAESIHPELLSSVAAGKSEEVAL